MYRREWHVGKVSVHRMVGQEGTSLHWLYVWSISPWNYLPFDTRAATGKEVSRNFWSTRYDIGHEVFLASGKSLRSEDWNRKRAGSEYVMDGSHGGVPKFRCSVSRDEEHKLSIRFAFVARVIRIVRCYIRTLRRDREKDENFSSEWFDVSGMRRACFLLT